MKVIHLGNQANVAATLVEALNRIEGVDAKCYNVKGYHHQGFGGTIYQPVLCSSTAGVEWFNMINEISSELMSADIIHVHASYLTASHLRGLCCDNIVLHFHGSEIRNKYSGPLVLGVEAADLVLYSTKDLEKSVKRYRYKSKPMWLPNPVDKRVFKPIKPYCDNRKHCVLYFRTVTEPLGASNRMVSLIEEKLGVPVEIIIREENWVPYDEMSELLNKYEYFLNDLSGDAELSYTSLQMLATGGKAITTSIDMIKDGEFNVISEFDETHDADTIAKVLHEEYKKIIEKNDRRKTQSK